MIRTFLYWLTDKLPAREINGEHDEPYLERYFLFRLLGVQTYIHRFVASDPDRGLHDHPWGWSVSLVLVGGYREIRKTGARTLKPWRLNLIRGTDFHRILIDEGQEAWTLFLHGRRTKGWGFLRDGKYKPFSKHKDDYPQFAWWWYATTGRHLRADRMADLLEDAAATIDGEALSLRECSTKGPDRNDWTGEDDALETYKHWKRLVGRLYDTACSIRRMDS
jgi:hypothetical protein